MWKNRWITEVRVKWDGKCPNVLKLMLLWPGSFHHFHSQRIKRRFENFLIHFLIIGKIWDKVTFEVMRGRARKKWIQSKSFNYILFHFLFEGYIFIFSSLAMFFEIISFLQFYLMRVQCNNSFTVKWKCDF